MDQREGKVLEEEVAEELAHSDVGPASVHQQEALEVAKLAEGVVAGHGGLHPLLPADSNADVCGWRSAGEDGTAPRSTFSSGGGGPGPTFDHVDVVGPVADGQRDGLLVLLHQTHHVGLLLGGNAAADDRLALAGHVDKVHLRRHARPHYRLRPPGVPEASPSLPSPVSSPSPSRPSAGRLEGCWEAVAFRGGAGADAGVFSSFRTEFRS